MNERVRAKEAKQGRSGKQVLVVMIVSLVLLVGIYFIYNLFASAPPDRQAVAPSGDADVVRTTEGEEVMVPENAPVTTEAEVVTVPKQQTPALATGADETPRAEESEPVVVPAPTGN